MDAMLSVYLHTYILSVAPYLLYVQRMIGAVDINRRAPPDSLCSKDRLLNTLLGGPGSRKRLIHQRPPS